MPSDLSRQVIRVGFSALYARKFYFLLALCILLVDQFTKSWAVSALSYAQPLPFVPFFQFTLLHNEGAAFGFLSQAGGWQRWVLGAVAFGVSAFLVVWMTRIAAAQRCELLGLSCILGGAIGNLWDRMALGYVVDFIDWYYPHTHCLPFFYARIEAQTCHWPAFNIADAAILMGVGLLMIDMFCVKRES